MKENVSPKSKITIDDLAQMIGRGFAHVDKRFDDMDVRLSGRIDGLELKIDNLDAKIDRIDSRLTNQLDYALLHYARRTELDLVGKRVTKIERNR